MAAPTTSRLPALPGDVRPLHSHVVLPLVFVGLGAVALFIDLPTSRFFASQSNTLLQQLVEAGETFGHAIGVLFILIAVAVLDPLRRPMLYRLAACSWGAGLVADVVKMMVARTRPHRFDLVTGDVLATFDRLFPLWTSGHGERSFPSAHTACAFGLAVGLACYYPRARGMFVTFAALCGLQRIQCGAHFVSDVCCGAALGWLWASFCLRGPWIAKSFDGLEARLQPAGDPSTVTNGGGT